MDSSYSSGTTKPLYRGTQVVWYVLSLLEVLLLFRFLLKLTGANPFAGFTSFVYAVTHVFTAPFLTVFRITRIEGSIFEWTTLLAMLVYWMIALAVIKLLFMGKTVSTFEAADKMSEEEEE